MSYAQRIILHAPHWDAVEFETFVEECIRDGVVLVCVVGDDCSRVEDVIDELVVSSGSDETRFLNTTAHPCASLDQVRRFAEAWTLSIEPGSSIQEVRLSSTVR